jgi:CHAD domain-containing protein
MAGTHALQPVVEVRTHRSSFDLSLDGTTVGEVALDSTTIPMGPGQEPARLRRIEVEVEAAAVDEVRPFVESMREACGLRPATVSKMEAGLLAAGLSPDSFLDFGPTEVDDSKTVGEVAFAVLRTQFGAFLRAEPGTRLGTDAEELHDMRVATRRLRAALKLFAEALPVRAGRVRDELKWIGGALGEVRDLDVQMDQVETWRADAPEPDREALGELSSVLEGQRAEARRRLLAALDSPRYERLVAAFGAMLRQGPLRRSPPSRMPILAAAPDLLGRRHRAVRRRGRRLGPNSPSEDLHALRIRAKRFRYAVEFTSPVYGKRSKKLVARLVALQDVLGDHQDARVAIERLRSLVADLGSSLSPGAVFAMGSIAERYAAAARDLHGQYPGVYKRIKKPWRRLERRLAGRRPGLPSQPRPPTPVAPDPSTPTVDS